MSVRLVQLPLGCRAGTNVINADGVAAARALWVGGGNLQSARSGLRRVNPEPRLAGRSVRRHLDVSLRLALEQTHGEIDVAVHQDDGGRFPGTENDGVSCDL